ncbi:MAG: HD domain-containing protein [Acutalibacteraceae bacterium]
MISQKEIKNVEQFIALCRDLLKNKYVVSMKNYNHHGTINTHFHSVYVAYTVMKICNILGTDKIEEVVRAALLHDFYLYDWHIVKHDELHAWYHPKESVRNIEKYNIIPLSTMQKEMIMHHMFPLASPPFSLGGWILIIADKHCANCEFLGFSSRFEELYLEISERIEKNDI